MHCFNEVQAEQSSAVSQLRTKWEEELLKWLLLEARLTGRSRLACEREIPQKVLVEFLRLEDSDSDVRWAAVLALKGQA